MSGPWKIPHAAERLSPPGATAAACVPGARAPRREELPPRLGRRLRSPQLGKALRQQRPDTTRTWKRKLSPPSEGSGSVGRGGPEILHSEKFPGEANFSSRLLLENQCSRPKKEFAGNNAHSSVALRESGGGARFK